MSAAAAYVACSGSSCGERLFAGATTTLSAAPADEARPRPARCVPNGLSRLTPAVALEKRPPLSERIRMPFLGGVLDRFNDSSEPSSATSHAALPWASPWRCATMSTDWYADVDPDGIMLFVQRINGASVDRSCGDLSCQGEEGRGSSWRFTKGKT